VSFGGGPWWRTLIGPQPLSPPAARRAQTLAAAGPFGALFFGGVVALRSGQGHGWDEAALWFPAAAGALSLASPFLARALRSVTAASAALAVGLCLLLPADALGFSGLGSVSFLATLAAPVLVGQLLGSRPALWSALWTAGVVSAAAFFEALGLWSITVQGAEDSHTLIAFGGVTLMASLAIAGRIQQREGERWRASVEERAERYALALSAGADGVFEWRIDGPRGQLYVSPYFASRVGLPGRPALEHLRALVHEEDHADFDELLTPRPLGGHRYGAQLRLRFPGAPSET